MHAEFGRDHWLSDCLPDEAGQHIHRLAGLDGFPYPRAGVAFRGLTGALCGTFPNWKTFPDCVASWMTKHRKELCDVLTQFSEPRASEILPNWLQDPMPLPELP